MPLDKLRPKEENLIENPTLLDVALTRWFSIRDGRPFCTTIDGRSFFPNMGDHVAWYRVDEDGEMSEVHLSGLHFQAAGPAFKRCSFSNGWRDIEPQLFPNYRRS